MWKRGKVASVPGRVKAKVGGAMLCLGLKKASPPVLVTVIGQNGISSMMNGETAIIVVLVNVAPSELDAMVVV